MNMVKELDRNFSEDRWGHYFWLYLYPKDLVLVLNALKKENLNLGLYGYDVGLVGFKITWVVTKEKFEPILCPYQNKPETQGLMKGMYCVRVSWTGKQDASHIVEFKKKYNFGLVEFGVTPDWLGEPIWIMYSPKTKARIKVLLEKIKNYRKNDLPGAS